MDNNRYCVIMAGGIGSRFWPISRTSKPKQFLDILGTGKTFLRMTFERFASIVATENFLVVTNAAYMDEVLRELPELAPNQVLCEPLGRNTAPCIAYAAFRIKAVNPNAVMVVTPADHLVIDQESFRHTIDECLTFAAMSDSLTTIGIRPTRPDTGYGYIQISKECAADCDIHKVKTFTEKPNRELACAFVQSGEFFWNSGIFVWDVKAIMGALESFLPETYAMFRSIDRFFNTEREQEMINLIYPQCRGISIDYGVMERSENVWVRCSDFGWSDIGTWGSMYQYSAKDDDGNTVSDNVSKIDTRNCVVRVPNGKIAVLDSLDNYIVVDTDDVLLVCPRDHEQEIKRFIEEVKFLPDGDKYI